MRVIRTFVRREGRSSKAQRLALAQLSTKYGLAYPIIQGKWEASFGRAGAKKVLEIGFGMGDALLLYAAQEPETDFLGVEVHTPGVGKVLLALEQQKLSNVRLCVQDSLEVLAQLAPNYLDAIHIFFPDPWPKTRHHKRRLIQTNTVALLVSRLKPTGILHLATDWENYAEQMLAVLKNCDELVPLCDSTDTSDGFSDRANRPITKFERRGLKLGHVIRDLRFAKRSPLY